MPVSPTALLSAIALLPANEPMAPRYTLTDETGESHEVDLVAFATANPDLVDAGELYELRQLPVGGERRYGGGAQPLRILRRVA